MFPRWGSGIAVANAEFTRLVNSHTSELWAGYGQALDMDRLPTRMHGHIHTCTLHTLRTVCRPAYTTVVDIGHCLIYRECPYPINYFFTKTRPMSCSTANKGVLLDTRHLTWSAFFFWALPTTQPWTFLLFRSIPTLERIASFCMLSQVEFAPTMLRRDLFERVSRRASNTFRFWFSRQPPRNLLGKLSKRSVPSEGHVTNSSRPI